MSFTIKCNKCGNEQLFNKNDEQTKENIELYVGQIDYENTVDRITIYCENDSCNHWIDINYK